MFSHGIQCNSSDQRLLKHDYQHIWEEGKRDGLVLQEVFVHYRDSCIQGLEGSASFNVFSDARKELLDCYRSKPVRRIRTTLRILGSRRWILSA
jgi:hypothetical protein